MRFFFFLEKFSNEVLLIGMGSFLKEAHCLSIEDSSWAMHSIQWGPPTCPVIQIAYLVGSTGWLPELIWFPFQQFQVIWLVD